MTKTIKALSFSLFDLERAIAQHDYTKLENNFMDFFEFVENGYNIESSIHKNSDGKLTYSHQGLIPFTDQMHYNEKLDLYSRLASVITSYLSDSKYTPPNDVLVRFVIYKTRITNIFYLSCYGNMDHILFNQNLLDESLSLNLKTEQDIKLFYACLSLNSKIQFDPEQLVNAIPYWGMYWYLGLLYGNRHSYNQQIEDNFNKVVDAHSLIETMEFDATSVELSFAPWMLCSYLDREDRHEIKKSINIAIEAWVKKKIPIGITKRVSRYTEQTTKIKKIAILSEHYTSKHAMYRCYHPELSLLKNRYHVTLVTANNRYDAISAQDFHEIIEVPDTVEEISSTAAKIAKLEPDLIIFPSLGMAKWTIPFANMRLAKYQMMCYGHPASAFSEYIDFSYNSDLRKEWDFQKFCMEKIIPVYRTTDFTWSPHPDYKPLPDKKPHDDIVRIAINSSLPKITSRFINLCQILQAHSTVKIEFNFFLISIDTGFEKSLLSKLGHNIKVYPPTDYMTYMGNLARCNLAIGTFPFGGSNTNIDLALLGIPKAIYGEKCGLASYADEGALARLDLPSILISQSESELLANLIYLIHNKPLLEEISNNIKESNPYDLFYNQKNTNKLDDNCKFLSSIRWIEEEN